MIGTQLGTYEIREEVGSGGMATVYRGYQANMDRFVAIKVIRTAILTDPTLRDRFKREARLIARLEHPHLLPVYDFDSDHDPPYIVMRYLEGGTLKQVMEAGKIPHGELIHMLKQVASALDYAHRQGIVHRDLKPSNIMIDREGNAFIADFGIARVTDSNEDLTGSGVLIGTPGYMAPEQARGESDVDHRADIYALAATVFEMLAGEPPYKKKSNLEVVMAHVNEAVPNICERDSELPKALDQVLKTGLAKDREERYATASALVNALATALEIQAASSPDLLQSMTQTISMQNLAQLQEATDGSGKSSDTPSDQQRQVTALYLDVTELAETLYEREAETATVRAVMDSLWSRLDEIVGSFGGVIQSRTDEVGVALWGMERAREDDAERAIRAALGLQAATLEKTKTAVGGAWQPSEESPLPFLAGITTGPVLLERDSETSSYMASGAAITLAGRLKEAAPAGGILVDHDTYTQVRGVFSFYEHDPLRVRGRKDLLDVYLVVSAKARAFRMQARGIEGIETRMIGREIELRLLQEAVTLTLEDAETQVVTVVGEAGVGKSRLLYEFTSWIDLIEQNMWFFEARATQPSMLQPFSLTRDLFSFRFQILDSDSIETVHEKFVAGIVSFMGEANQEKAELIGQLVGFDFSNYPRVAAAIQNPEEFQTQALGYLGEFFLKASETNPIIIQIEDIHWADDRSLDLINNLVRENTQIPLFIICMARPSLYERRPQWGEGQRYHARVQLEPLSQLSSRRLVKELLKLVEKVPTTLRDLIIDRADGNPFYIEELIKSLIDDRVIIKGTDSWDIDETRLSTVRIPPTLTGVLQSRLDTLPSGLQQILQRASVIGRVFWDAALVQLSETDGVTPTAASSMLSELRNREMIFQREKSGFEGTAEFVFRHAILRDVTYQTLVPRQRKIYHKLVGDWLIGIGGERASEQNLLVAKHYELAGEPALAAQRLIEAANETRGRGSTIESIQTLQGAKELIKDEEERTLLLNIQIDLGESYSLVSEHRKALAEIEPAADAAREMGEKAILAKALAQLGRISGLWLGEPEKGRVYLSEALPLARDLEDISTQIFVLRMIGTLYMMDEAADPQPYLLESLELGRKMNNMISTASVLNTLAIINGNSGEIEKAREQFRESQEQFESLGSKFGIAMVLTNEIDLDIREGLLGDARVKLERGLSLAAELDHVGFTAGLNLSLAKIQLLEGDTGAAKLTFQRGAKHALEAGEPSNQLDSIAGHVALLRKSGDPERALTLSSLINSNSSADPIQKRDSLENIEALREELPAEKAEDAIQKGMGLPLEEELKKILEEY